MPNTLTSWAVWFYDTFVDPLVHICKNTDVLGFSLFEWIISFSVISMAVGFIRALFGAENRGD